MTLVESRLAYIGSNKARQPMTLRVFEDRVECRTPGLLTRGTLETIHYGQIAQVAIDRRVTWSKLAVETNGGGGFAIGGLKKTDAEAAKALIDERVAQVRSSVPTSAPESTTSVADELAKLSVLRDSGALTEEEFAAAKARLLGLST